MHKHFTNILFLLCTALITFVLFKTLSLPINLVNSDLGRHLMNGKLIKELDDTKSLLNTNFYSYTSPDSPFTLHHWGGGYIFYMFEQTFGIESTQDLYIVLIVLSALILLSVSKIYYGAIPSLVGYGLSTMLLGYRAEIRPEGFSVLFMSIFIALLIIAKNNYRYMKWLYILPLLMMLWVNIHIYFIFGFGLIGLSIITDVWELRPIRIKSILSKTSDGVTKRIQIQSIVLLLSALATIISPFGIYSLFSPFKMFENYGYTVIENQSFGFLSKLGIWLPEFTVVIIIGSIIFLYGIWRIKKTNSAELFGILLTLFFAVFAFLATRNISQVSLPLILVGSAMIFNLTKLLKNQDWRTSASAIILLITILTTYIFNIEKINTYSKGMIPNQNAPIEFWKANNLKGPIFNNYDIGSYLIYYLYPEERVFVDNRPEGYSSEFFTNEYINPQLDPARFKKLDTKYNFNAVIFNHMDQTNWGQDFLSNVVTNPEWSPVYFDQQVIILLKRNAKNQKIIDKYQIPISTK